MGYAIGTIIFLCAFFQGGYFPTIFLIVGIVFIVIYIFFLHAKTSPLEIVLFSLAGIYIATSLINGYSFSSLSQACLPLVCVCFLRCFLCLSHIQRNQLLQVLTIGSTIWACIALLAFCGLLDISGAVTSHRLQFPFQYANAAGAWYAALTFIRPIQKQKIASWSILPNLTALFLTRSVGVLGFYVLFTVIQLVCCRKGRPDLWKETILINAVALLFSVALYVAAGFWAMLLIAFICVIGIWLDRLLGLMKQIYLHYFCLAGGVLVAVGVLFSQRLAAGLGTFSKRQ